jgi:hypothetical protein
VERVFSPLDHSLKLTHRGWSESVSELAVWVGGQVSFGVAAELLERVGNLKLSASSIWREVQEWGQVLVELEEKERQRANATPGREEIIAGTPVSQQRKGVAIDGWMINIRDEGWKEVKLGTVFEVTLGQELDPVTAETVEVGQAVDCTYVAHLGGPEQFGESLWAEALRRDVHAAYDKVCLGDGATWIWNLCQDYFPEAEQIVDWYHAKDHLSSALNLAYADQPHQLQRQLKGYETALYLGRASSVASWLDQLAQAQPEVAEGLHKQATYFRNNQRRMQYLEYRENDWPIGSGMVESACKQLQMRLKGPGCAGAAPVPSVC